MVGTVKEVECGNHFTVIVEEGQPALGFALVVVRPEPLQISGYGRLGNFQPQLEQFAVNTRCTPSWIVRLHAANQVANLPVDFRSSRSAEARPQSPKQPKSGAVPRYSRVRFH